MPELIAGPTCIEAAGEPPKSIHEYVGRVNSGEPRVSVAHLHSPPGWSEPGQRPTFDEYTVVLRGALVVDYEGGRLEVGAFQAVHCRPGEWVRYGSSRPVGAQYISLYLPTFSSESLHRHSTGPTNRSCRRGLTSPPRTGPNTPRQRREAFA